MQRNQVTDSKTRIKYVGYQREVPPIKLSNSAHPKTRDADVIMTLK